MATFRTSQGQHGNEVLEFMNEDVSAVKGAIENLNTRKSTSIRIETGILSNNFEHCEIF